MFTTLNISHSYGMYSLDFYKEFDLPFTPFYNMVLNFTNNMHEHFIYCINNDYCTTEITYDIKEKTFNIDIRHSDIHRVSDETIDETIELFQQTEFTRTDNTNIDALKSLMKR